MGLRVRSDMKRCVFAAIGAVWLVRLVVSVGIFLHPAKNEMENHYDKARQNETDANEEHTPGAIAILLKSCLYDLCGIVINPDGRSDSASIVGKRRVARETFAQSLMSIGEKLEVVGGPSTSPDICNNSNRRGFSA